MAKLLFELRSSLKLLARHPFFTLSVVTFLTIGIGLNAAAFSVVNALLLRPVPGVEKPEAIIAVFTRVQGNPFYLPVSYPNFQDLQRDSHELAGLAAYQTIRVAQTGSGEAEMVSGAMTSSNYFDVLGVHPFKGRFFGPSENGDHGESPVVVLGYGFWKRRFGTNPAVLGRTILLNGSLFTVIGIAPPAFRGTSLLAPAQLWVPLTMYKHVYSASDLFPHRSDQTLQLVGRLRPETTLQEAATEIDVLGTRLVKEYPTDNYDQTFATLSLAESALNPNARRSFVEVATFLMLATLLLLGIACVNVASILLVRALERMPELAIRLSLGAGRRGLAQQLLIEGLVLATISYAICLLVVAPFGRLLWNLRPPFLQQEILQHPFDVSVLSFGLLISLTTGLLFSLAPMLQTLRSDLVQPLKGAVYPLDRSWSLPIGSVLVTLQVALCFGALVCASFFLKNLLQAQKIDPGFDTQNLLTISFDFQSQKITESDVAHYEQTLLQRTENLPGVLSAALAENRILGGARISRSLSKTPNFDTSSPNELFVGSNLVSSNYFKTVGIPVQQGRSFDASDRRGSTRVVIINETLAGKISPGKSLLGEYLFMDRSTDPYKVVGVVGDAKVTTLGERPRPLLYLPLHQFYTPTVTLHVRLVGEPQQVLGSIRREVQAITPGLPLIEVRTVEEILREALWWQRATATILSVFSLFALGLAGLGIYGITAYSAGQRRFEIGVRMALGAQRSGLIALISRRGLATGLLGIFLGIPLALGLTRLARNLLLGADSGTLIILLGIGLLVFLVSLTANIIPALRASCAEAATLIKNRSQQ